MRNLIITTLIISLASICNAQKKQPDTSTIKFTPPVIIKDSEIAGNQNQEAVKFIPPVIKKNQTSKGRKTKSKEAVKFTPPVITKDSEKNN